MYVIEEFLDFFNKLTFHEKEDEDILAEMYDAQDREDIVQWVTSSDERMKEKRMKSVEAKFAKAFDSIKEKTDSDDGFREGDGDDWKDQ